MSKSYRIIAQLISLLGLGAASYLTWLHFAGPDTKSGLCDALSETGCAVALDSAFASIAGIPLSIFLIGTYITLGIAAHKQSQGRHPSTRPWSVLASLLCLGTLTGGIFLLGVMAESQSYCPMCIFMDGCNLILAFIWIRNSLSQPGPSFSAKPWLVTLVIMSATTAIGTLVQNQIFSESDSASKSSSTAIPLISPTKKLTVEQCQDVELSALEISDFLCPYCKKLEHNLSEVLTECGARVDKRFVHFPLDKSCNRFVSRDLHPGACRLAEASECARIQGKFRPFAASLFATTPKTDEALWAMATEHELDLDQFKTCLRTGLTQDRVRTDIELAQRLGVRSTPTFYINGRRLEGALSKKLIEAEISRALSNDQQEAQNIAGTPDSKDAWQRSEPAEACGADSFSQKKQGCSKESTTNFFDLDKPKN